MFGNFRCINSDNRKRLVCCVDTLGKAKKTGGRKRQRAGADDKAEGLTIRKLTRGNPTMKAMFAAIADKSVDGQEEEHVEETV